MMYKSLPALSSRGLQLPVPGGDRSAQKVVQSLTGPQEQWPAHYHSPLHQQQVSGQAELHTQALLEHFAHREKSLSMVSVCCVCWPACQGPSG